MWWFNGTVANASWVNLSISNLGILVGTVYFFGIILLVTLLVVDPEKFGPDVIEDRFNWVLEVTGVIDDVPVELWEFNDIDESWVPGFIILLNNDSALFKFSDMTDW